MILKSYEIQKIKTNINNLILFYGQNQGAKEEAISKIIKDNQNRSVIKYEEKEFLENSETTFENILSKSLFEDKKLIIINRASDKIVNSISYFQEKNLTDIIIIIEANNLDKRSKLRSFFEKDKNCICVAFYPDNQESLSKIIYVFLKENNLKISQSNLNLIINKCNGDRGVLKNELNKILFFTKNNKKLTEENLFKLINLIENYSISELIDNCLAKNKNKTLLMLNENIFNVEDCIIITRIFLQKIKRLLKLNKEFSKNNNIEKTVLEAKPAIFWKDKEIVKQQIKNWNSGDIFNLLNTVNQIELLVKKNKTDPINIIRNLIIEIISVRSNNTV